jgi:hypothetical protein
LCIDKNGETVQGTSFSPAKKVKGDLILFFWHMSATLWLFHGFYHMKKKKPRCEKGQQPRYKKKVYRLGRSDFIITTRYRPSTRWSKSVCCFVFVFELLDLMIIPALVTKQWAVVCPSQSILPVSPIRATSVRPVVQTPIIHFIFVLLVFLTLSSFSPFLLSLFFFFSTFYLLSS